MLSYLIYNTIALVSLFFSYISSIKYKTFNSCIKKIFAIISFVTLFLFSACRFDVGPDYETYVETYYNIVHGSIVSGIDKFLFMFLSTSFSGFYKGYIYVFATYSFLTLYFVFKSLYERKYMFWGVGLFIFLGIYLDSFDRVRQLLAVSIFLYSIKYIEQRNIIKYLTALIFGSLAHLSILLLVPFYFINLLKISTLSCFSIIIALFFLQSFGVTEELLLVIYKYVPHYNEIYQNTSFMSANGNYSTGLGFLFNVVLLTYGLYISRTNLIFRNTLFVGVLLYLISIGNLNVSRFTQYFTSVIIFAVPYGFGYIKYKAINKCVLFSLLLVFYQSQIARNNYTYHSIFSSEYSSEKFELRQNR
ncbi:MAG: EpsG family protein [Longicatena sp.]|uniref:Transmembrane protein EpsG n=1 Tax=Hafnia alvei TaxID=569 RepID=A0A172X017_HAFAL|nr:EpsG family protein [Hafnia paralvei]ANF29966.1 transmembrane protein EpsG [Hafnia alvei]TBM00681.1 EpsG family protein [Hafnia paralvei]